MSDDVSFGERLSGRQAEDLINSYRTSPFDVPFKMPAQAAFSLGTYQPPGPVGAAYIRSPGPIDVIMGPAGSGKTVASVFKLMRFAVNTMPVCRDSKIRVKATIVRDNFRSLYRSTMQTWLHCFPTALYPDLSGGQDRPACHKLLISTVRRDGRIIPVDLQVDMFAIGDLNYEMLFKSYETSYAWATEADGVKPEAVPFFFSRTGRYPSLDQLPEGVERPRVMGVDMNPPAPKHPLLLAAQRGSFREDFDPLKDKRTVNFFVQPSGLSPEAENRAGKTEAEYKLEMETMPKDEARRMVLGLPGRVKDGLPVYDLDWDRDKHVSKGPLEILPNVPLNAGFDQGGQSGGGGQPAVFFFQIAPSGQRRGLFSLACPPGTGADRFLEQVVPVVRIRFRGLPPGVWTGDPAGFMGGDRVYKTLAWFDIIMNALGHRIDPAPTQEWTPRLESIGRLLRRGTRETPQIILCPVHCNPLIEALEGEFKFGKRLDGSFDNLPVKNMAANVGEAAQYGELGISGVTGIQQALLLDHNPGNVHQLAPRAVVQSADWNVL